MAWTNVNKPTTPTWTYLNPQGREQYDESTIEYDDANVFYDGVNPNQWTDIAKPTYSLTWNDLPIAWNSYPNPWQSPTWTQVSKPQ